MPTRHRTNFTPKGEVKKCPTDLYAKLRSPHCRVEQSEFQPHNRPKPSPSPGPGPGPGPGPTPPFVPGYNPGDGPTPVDPVGPFPPPPPPPSPSGGSGFPYGPVIAGSVVGGIAGGLLARRALQSSMRAQIDPAPDQPAGSIEYQGGTGAEGEGGLEGDVDTVGADGIEDTTEGLIGTETTTTSTVAGGTTDALGAGADIGSEASTAMTTTSLDASFFSGAAEIAVPAAEEATLLAASGATAEAGVAEGVIEAAGEALAATDTAADIAAAEAIAAAGPDELTFGAAGVIAGAAAAAAGLAATAGIIIAYKSGHKRPPSTTALTNQQITATISNLTGAVVKHPTLQSQLNALASAQTDGRPIYNVYNGTKTTLVAQLSYADLVKAQASYNSNPNFFKGQDPNVLSAMGLDPLLTQGKLILPGAPIFNAQVVKQPPPIPPTTTTTPPPTTGGSSTQKPGIVASASAAAVKAAAAAIKP